MSELSFLSASLLIAFLALPLLWLLLKTLPPPPRPIILPTARFLKDLIAPPSQAQTIPWWLRTIRLLIATCLILFLAYPVLQPENQALKADGPVVLVIDNSWASAKNWGAIIESAQSVIDIAANANQTVEILATAALGPNEAPLSFAPTDARTAATNIRTLHPVPWPADLKFITNQLTENASSQLFWIGHGIDEGSLSKTIGTFKNQKTYIGPTLKNLPTLLKLNTEDLSAEIRLALPDTRPRTFGVNLYDRKNNVIDQRLVTIPSGTLSASVTFNANDAAAIKLVNEHTSASTIILPTRLPRKNVALIGSDDLSSANAYLNDVFYLKHAIEKTSNLTLGPLEGLALKNHDVIVLADQPITQPEMVSALQTWVDDGGILLRFAGPKLSNISYDPLLPVGLRQGARSLNSSFALEKPLTPAPFPITSPLATAPDLSDVTVHEQILADSLPSNDPLVWATLSDGTPFITGKKIKNGLIVLIHTTAGPAWSDLPLSGGYIQLLRTIIDLAPAKLSTGTTPQTLDLIRAIDAQGGITSPTSPVPNAKANELLTRAPSALTPPGLYGSSGFVAPFNLSNQISAITGATLSAPIVTKTFNEQIAAQDLRPLFITLALVFFLLDLLLTSALRYRKILFACLAIIYLIPSNAYAIGDKLSLAFVQTGNALVDSDTQQGLQTLSEVLSERTAISMGDVAALNPEKLDDIALYPIIYWPITPEMQPLHARSISNIQNYLDRGGTILFDTRDQFFKAQDMTGIYSRNAEILKNFLKPLSFAPVVPITKEHVLHRTFYLLDNFTGAYTTATLYLAQDGTENRDGVSSVIIGSNDYARGWAELASGINTSAEENAARTGVNIILYALTGNYKTDQIHLQNLLDRMSPTGIERPL